MTDSVEPGDDGDARARAYGLHKDGAFGRTPSGGPAPREGGSEHDEPEPGLETPPDPTAARTNDQLPPPRAGVPRQSRGPSRPTAPLTVAEGELAGGSPVTRAGGAPTPTPPSEDGAAPSTERLLDGTAAERLRRDWREAQYDFVDDPRAAVERADAILERATLQLADAVRARRTGARRTWEPVGPGSAAHDGGTPTEELRLAMHRYRAVLERVLDL